MSVEWNLNDSTSSLPPNIAFLYFFKENDPTQPKCDKLSKYTDSAHTELEDFSSRCINASDEYAGTTEDNFILPTPPVGGMTISQDRIDRMKDVRNRTIPITLPSGKNILADTMFKISIVHISLGMRQL